MIVQTLFSQPAYIEMQGEHVLELLELTDDHAYYKINGFRSPHLFLTDYRQNVNLHLKNQLAKDDLSQFIYSFCGVAQVTLKRQSNGNLFIDLYETDVTIPDYMAWFVVGYEGEMPKYPYEFQLVQRIDMNFYAGFVFYPLEQEKMRDFIVLAQHLNTSC